MASILSSTVDISDCLTNCSQNGLCAYSATLNKFTCECDQYFTGPTCSIDIRPCSSKPCLNNGTCIEDLSDLSYYICDCGSFYEGVNCETKIDICQNETCSSHGKCIDDKNVPKCVCFSLYEGTYCEITSQSLKTIQSIISTCSIIAILTLISLYLFFIVMDIIRIFFMKEKYVPRRKNITKLYYTP